MTYYYQPEILEQLLVHGVRPAPATRPAFVQSWLNDLYRYELRRLKSRLIAKEFAQADYATHVVALRQRYPLVAIPVHLWTVRGTPAEPTNVPLC
jgi:hypothetical protein